MLLDWLRAEFEVISEAQRGDPGLVVIPRLSKHEYRNVLRDLSGGVVTRAGEYLPGEGGAGEGFSNVGEAQGMTPAVFEKYLEAAKGSLRHLRVSAHAGLVWNAVPATQWTSRDRRSRRPRMTSLPGMSLSSRNGANFTVRN
jgi:hypothetical protein